MLGPAEYIFRLNPSVKIEITNSEKEIKNYTAEVDSFKIDSKTGQAIFDQVDEAEKWISIETVELKLNPGQTGQLFFTIVVPKDAEPGEHNFGLFVKEKNTDGQVMVSSRVGSLLFLTVAGQVEEKLIKEIFSVEKNKLFFDLRNIGSVHAVPQGEIILTNWWNKEIGRIVVNQNSRKILPEGRWEEEYNLNNNFGWEAFGLIKATADVHYGVTNQLVSVSTSYWYWPRWTRILSMVGGLLIAVIGAGIYMKNKY